MQPLTLRAGVPIGLPVQGRTLSIVNDVMLALTPIYDQNTSLDPLHPDIVTGSVLVGFDAVPASPATADAIVPPFSSVTIPVPGKVAVVFLLYPIQGHAAIAPLLESARTQISYVYPNAGSQGGGPLSVGVAWSDAEGPLAITPTGSIIGRRLGDFLASAVRMPIDVHGIVIPPSPATNVYDQDVGNSRGGPFLRPHLAPSRVSYEEWFPAVRYVWYPALLGGTDAFSPPPAPSAVCRAIHRVYISIWGVTATTLLSIATAAGTTFIATRVFADCNLTWDFGPEGIAPGWDGPGQYNYVVDRLVGGISVLVIHG